MITHDLTVPGGTLRWYEAGPGDAPITAMWHHGTPNIGEPPAPLLEESAARGIRWLGFDRPGYGGSTATEGRDVASAAYLAARVADASGTESFVAVGHSGGGPHAFACSALLGERVSAAVAISGLSPYVPGDDEWFDGMHEGGEAELRAAIEGPSRLATVLAAADFDPQMFTAADYKLLDGEWSWFNRIAAEGVALGLDGSVADNVAYVNDWGFTLLAVTAPVLLVHGGEDRIVPIAQARHNAAALRGAGAGAASVDLWELPGDGHLSVLRQASRILDWIVEHAR